MCGPVLREVFRPSSDYEAIYPSELVREPFNLAKEVFGLIVAVEDVGGAGGEIFFDILDYARFIDGV
jgi:hypothetical protein